jgi:hypothetical protein
MSEVVDRSHALVEVLGHPPHLLRRVEEQIIEFEPGG